MAEAALAIRKRAKFVLAHRIGYLFCYQSDYIILPDRHRLSLLSYYAEYQYYLRRFVESVPGNQRNHDRWIAKRQLDRGAEAYLRIYRKTSYLSAFAAVVCGVGFYSCSDFAIRIIYHSQSYDHAAALLFAIYLMLNIYKINDDLWVDTTGIYHLGYYLPMAEACTYVTLGLLCVHRYHMAGILYGGIATNLIFSVLFKSFVLARESCKVEWPRYR